MADRPGKPRWGRVAALASGMILAGAAVFSWHYHRAVHGPPVKRIPKPPVPAEMPPGFVWMLPPGRLAAVDAPTFVPASEANLPADATVLGLVAGGEPRAYSLALLQSREVVNDQAGDRAFAVVW